MTHWKYCWPPEWKAKATFCTTGNTQTLEPVPSIPRFDGEQGPEDEADSALSVICPWKYPPHNEDNRCLSLGEQTGTLAKTGPKTRECQHCTSCAAWVLQTLQCYTMSQGEVVNFSERDECVCCNSAEASYNTINYVLCWERWCLCSFHGWITLREKNCRILLAHQVHAENLRSVFFLLLLPVGRCCKAHSSFKFPVAKALKRRERHFSKGLPTDTQAAQENMFPSCSCLLFFSLGSFMHICARPFRRAPRGMRHILGWSSNLEDCHAPACKQMRR